MNIQYPDYGNCLVNLACSIGRHFGVGTDATTLKMCDALLEKSYKNVVILLLDGLGKAIMDRNLDENGFFFRHLQGTFSSVFPPTTVAATTSVQSGQYPSAHCWLGWDCYYPQIDKNVTVFRNTESGTDCPAADFNVAETFCPFDSIVERVRCAGFQGYNATPFVPPFPQDFESICQRIEMLCALEGRKYIYSYWKEPDSTIHATGCGSTKTKSVLKALEDSVQALCEKLSDTLLLVTADHGLIDSDCAVIADYPKLMECLLRMPSIEPRAMNFFIKEGKQAQFQQEFLAEFGDKFLLLSKDEVKASRLFGPGPEHPNFDGMLGDFLAVAVSDLSLYNTAEEKEHFIGVHAGLTEEEMTIPLIAISLP